MSAWWRATWWSSRMPLPPSMSRASAQTRRAADAVAQLGKRGVVQLRAALALQLRQPHAQGLHGGDVGEHVRELVLHELEAREWPAELLAAQRVGRPRPRRRRRRARAPPRPRSGGTWPAPVSVSSNVRARGEPGVGRHLDPVELDLGLPDGAVGGLAGDPLGLVAGDRVGRRRRGARRRSAPTSPSSSRAQTTTMSATVPLPIQRLGRADVQPPPVRCGRGWSGGRRRGRGRARSARTRRACSRRPWQAASAAFCSSEPSSPIAVMARPECTALNVAMLPSPRASSAATRPSATAGQARAAVAGSVPPATCQLAVAGDERHGNSARSQ